MQPDVRFIFYFAFLLRVCHSPHYSAKQPLSLFGTMNSTHNMIDNRSLSALPFLLHTIQSAISHLQTLPVTRLLQKYYVKKLSKDPSSTRQSSHVCITTHWLPKKPYLCFIKRKTFFHNVWGHQSITALRSHSPKTNTTRTLFHAYAQYLCAPVSHSQTNYRTNGPRHTLHLNMYCKEHCCYASFLLTRNITLTAFRHRHGLLRFRQLNAFPYGYKS